MVLIETFRTMREMIQPFGFYSFPSSPTKHAASLTSKQHLTLPTVKFSKMLNIANAACVFLTRTSWQTTKMDTSGKSLALGGARK